MNQLHPTIAQAIAPFVPQRFGQTPVGHFMLALNSGYKPSAAELRDLAYELQGALVNCPEIEWLHTTFENVGDAIHQAMKEAQWAAEFCADRSDHSNKQGVAV